MIVAQLARMAADVTVQGTPNVSYIEVNAAVVVSKAASRSLVRQVWLMQKGILLTVYLMPPSQVDVMVLYSIVPSVPV
jgi:hypothetical protein